MINTLLRGAARAACRLPLPLVRWLAGPPRVVDGQTLDPLVQFMVKYFSDPPGTLDSVEKTRQGFDQQGAWLAHRPDPRVKLQAWSLLGPHGAIACEIHRPPQAAAQGAPALIFYHGGGHCAGSLQSHRDVCRQLARDGHCVVIAVDYRLAPEHRFPVGIDDCIAAYDAVMAESAALGIDPDRIGVGGDSAGGNAAAVVAQQRRACAHPPRLQMLWVPWVDMGCQSASYGHFALGYFLERPKMEWYTNHYLRSAADACDPKASPLQGDVSGVCRAVLLVAGFDPLRDEGLAYAQKLEAAGVPTTLRLYSELVHPFINVAGCVPAARRAFDDATALLRQHL